MRHFAVIYYAVPPTLVIVAHGPLDFCKDELAKYLARHPMTPYNDDDECSGGEPMVLSQGEL